MGKDLIHLLKYAGEEVVAGRMPPSNILTLLASKILGYLVMVGASIVKVPQILAVLRSRSAEGLSALSFEMETLALLITCCYGYIRGMAFSTYGEAVFLVAQNLILLALIYKFSRASALRSLSVTMVLVAIASVVATGNVTTATVERAYDLNNIIVTSARVPQIYKNFQAGGTGQLSMITYVANLLGCAARVFTSLAEGGGVAMVRSYVLAGFLNGVLAAQILYYGGAGRKKAGASKKQR